LFEKQQLRGAASSQSQQSGVGSKAFRLGHPVLDDSAGVDLMKLFRTVFTDKILKG
jgi:hypothetical protein